MTAAIPDSATALRQLMNDKEHREVECQVFLQYAHLLLAPPMSRVVQVVEQQIGMAGRSDYFIVCEVNEVDIRRRLFLWEAKAPQLAPFEFMTKNRLLPSRALVEAENQLLYYYDEYRSSGQFLHRYQIQHADDVRLGGIVIGREDNLVEVDARYNTPVDVLRQMAISAFRIRDEHFYRSRIQVLTWDQIARVLSVKPVGTV